MRKQIKVIDAEKGNAGQLINFKSHAHIYPFSENNKFFTNTDVHKTRAMN